ARAGPHPDDSWCAVSQEPPGAAGLRGHRQELLRALGSHAVGGHRGVRTPAEGHRLPVLRVRPVLLPGAAGPDHRQLGPVSGARPGLSLPRVGVCRGLAHRVIPAGVTTVLRTLLATLAVLGLILAPLARPAMAVSADMPAGMSDQAVMPGAADM